MFDSAELNIKCPKCSQENKKTIAWIKNHDQLTCIGCGSTIHIEKAGLISGLKSAEKSVDDFKKTLKRLGRR